MRVRLRSPSWTRYARRLRLIRPPRSPRKQPAVICVRVSVQYVQTRRRMRWSRSVIITSLQTRGLTEQPRGEKSGDWALRLDGAGRPTGRGGRRRDGGDEGHWVEVAAVRRTHAGQEAGHVVAEPGVA